MTESISPEDMAAAMAAAGMTVVRWCSHCNAEQAEGEITFRTETGELMPLPIGPACLEKIRVMMKEKGLPMEGLDKPAPDVVD